MPLSPRKRVRLTPDQVAAVRELIALGTLSDKAIATQVGIRRKTVMYHRLHPGPVERGTSHYHTGVRLQSTERTPTDPTKTEIAMMTEILHGPKPSASYREIEFVRELPPYAGWRRFEAVVLFAAPVASQDIDYLLPEWLKLSAMTPDGIGRDDMERFRLRLDASVPAEVEEVQAVLRHTLGIVGVDLHKRAERVGKTARARSTRAGRRTSE